MSRFRLTPFQGNVVDFGGNLFVCLSAFIARIHVALSRYLR